MSNDGSILMSVEGYDLYARFMSEVNTGGMCRPGTYRRQESVKRLST